MNDEDHISDEDRALFRGAVGGVKEVKSNLVPEEKSQKKPLLYQQQRDQQQVMLDAVGEQDPDIESGEELSYHTHGISKAILRKLKRGQFRVELELDLHGLTQREAQQSLKSFYQEAVNDDCRVVRIIHGKGYSSEGRPVLKSLVANWLPLHSRVLAFCSAPPKQGGTGAVLVLLKR